MIFTSILFAVVQALSGLEEFRIPALPERDIPKLWDQPEFPKDLLPFFRK